MRMDDTVLVAGGQQLLVPFVNRDRGLVVHFYRCEEQAIENT
jgi:hypothetical protein